MVKKSNQLKIICCGSLTVRRHYVNIKSKLKLNGIKLLQDEFRQ